MTTAFKTVQDALVTLLQTPAIVTGAVRAGRALPLPQDQTSDIAVSLEALAGQDISLTGAPKDWGVTYAIAMRARGSATVDAMQALDPIFETVYARVATGAPPAGVMGWVLQPRVVMDVEEGDTPIGRMALFLDVRLRTQPGSLALAA